MYYRKKGGKVVEDEGISDVEGSLNEEGVESL